MEEGTCPATPLHCICAPSLCSISLPCFAQYFFALLCAVFLCPALRSISLTCFAQYFFALLHLVQYFFVLACPTALFQFFFILAHKSCLHFAAPPPLALICFLMLSFIPLCSISLPCFAQYLFTLFHLVQFLFVLVCFFILSFVPLCLCAILLSFVSRSPYHTALQFYSSL